MHVEDLPGEASAADRVEGDRGAGRGERRGEVVGEGRRRRVAHVLGAGGTQQLLLLARAHDVDERDAVGEAQPVEHLAEVRGGGGVDERGVAFAPHRADQAEHGQRVDEARRPLDCGDAGRQLQALRHVDAAVLRVHRPTEQADRLAEQRLRRRRRAGGDDRAGALVADRQRVADPAAKGSQHIGRDRRRHGRRLARARERRRRHVGATEQQSEVGRVDRCSLDAHEHLAVTRRRDVDGLQRQMQRAVRLHKGAQLQASGRDLGHVPIMAARPEQIDVVEGDPVVLHASGPVNRALRGSS